MKHFRSFRRRHLVWLHLHDLPVDLGWERATFSSANLFKVRLLCALSWRLAETGPSSASVTPALHIEVELQDPTVENNPEAEPGHRIASKTCLECFPADYVKRLVGQIPLTVDNLECYILVWRTSTEAKHDLKRGGLT